VGELAIMGGREFHSLIVEKKKRKIYNYQSLCPIGYNILFAVGNR